MRLISLALQTKTNSIWESNRRIFFIFKNATDWVLSLDRDSIYSYQISYKSPLTVLPFENLYFTESNSYTQLIDYQNFMLKISFAMSTWVCKSTVIEKRQHQLGRMADFPLLVTFSVFDLQNYEVPQIKSQTMQHPLMNLVS